MNDQIAEKSNAISKLEAENNKLNKIIVEKDQSISEMLQLKKELTDVKVEYNKLKIIFDNDILNKYEHSLKEASNKLREAEMELERTQQLHQDQIEQVFLSIYSVC